MFSDRKCHDCAFLPICDGGCVVRRYNKLHDGADYDPCPLSEEDFYTLLDITTVPLKWTNRSLN